MHRQLVNACVGGRWVISGASHPFRWVGLCRAFMHYPYYPTRWTGVYSEAGTYSSCACATAFTIIVAGIGVLLSAGGRTGLAAVLRDVLPTPASACDANSCVDAFGSLLRTAKLCSLLVFGYHAKAFR